MTPIPPESNPTPVVNSKHALDVESSPLGWLRNNWNHPAQGAAAFAAAIFSFWQPPLEDIAVGGTTAILALSRAFIIPIVWLLMSVPARFYRSRKHVRSWVAITTILFSLSLVIWFEQNEKIRSWIVYSPILNKHFVIGETFLRETVEDRQFVEKKVNRHIISEQKAIELLKKTRPEKLIEGTEDHDSESVWDAREIQSRRRALSQLYILGVPVFVMSLIAALQSWYCAGRPK